MFCPKCGAQNIEDAKFCRGCGADIGLVPQALTGHLQQKRAVGYDAEGQPYDESGERIHKRKESPRLDKAISTGFTGLGFLVVSIILAFTKMGYGWWYWLLLPAFSMIGGGIAEYVRYKQAERKFNTLPPIEEPRRAMPSAPARVSALPPRNTSELVPPPSVTEGTTRHLDMSREAPTRHTRTPAEKSAKDV